MSRIVRTLLLLCGVAALGLAFASCTPEQGPADSQGGASAAPPEGEVFEWVQATPWADPVLPQQWLYKRNDMLKEITNGRLVIKTHPGGAIMGAKECFDATNNGTIDLFNGTLHTWMGKMPSSPLFSARPMGFTADQWLAWFENGGSQFLTTMLSGFNFGYAGPAVVSTPEDLCWSNKKMTTLEDWKGVKFRTKGLWADVLQDPRVGAAVTTLSGSELYSALERGILDATEYSTADVDRSLAFYEVCDYVMVPGIHQPSTVHMDVVNKDSWEALPADLQAAYRYCNAAVCSLALSDYVIKDAEAFVFFEELEGLEIVVVPEKLQNQFLQIANDLYEQKSSEYPFFGEVYQHQMDFIDQYNLFKSYQTPEFG